MGHRLVAQKDDIDRLEVAAPLVPTYTECTYRAFAKVFLVEIHMVPVHEDILVTIPLNIAEGNGKTAKADRRRYFEIARGSALECAAIQDVLVVGKALGSVESLRRKSDLDRIAVMLSRLGGRGYSIKEASTPYGYYDPDFDCDFDPDEIKSP